MTKYIKTGTTEFEQLDGWQKTFEKYGIRIESADDLSEAVLDELVPRGRYFIKTLECELECHIGDWIATGVNGEHWPVEDEIFKQTYKRLPVITAAVADYIGWCKGQNVDLRDALYFSSDGFTYVEQDEDRIGNWASNHQDEFARAWLDGYEVADE